MSDISFNQISRLTDSMEREVIRMQAAQLRAETMVALGKQTLAFLKKALSSAYDYMIDVSRALDEARAKNAQFTRAQW
ncbi:MAG: hypothetical protein AB7E12_03600 [Burkholderiaceae bacterium]|jgi:hypothetical protein